MSLYMPIKCFLLWMVTIFYVKSAIKEKKKKKKKKKKIF